MREEALTPFDVHVHPRSDGGLDLHARAGHAGVWGQADASSAASKLTRLEATRRDLDGDDIPESTPGTAAPYHDLSWSVEEGANVFRTLLPTAVQKLYRRCMREARREGSTLAFRVRYSDTAGRRLHEVPWELAFDPDEAQFLALWPETCLARYLQMPRAERPGRRGPRNLFLSMAKSTVPLDFQEECSRIGAVTRKVIRPTSSIVASSQEVRHELSAAAQADRPYLAWHHVGHGTSTKSGQFTLKFDGDGHHGHAADATDETTLADLVATVAASGVRCAVLNICHSGRSSGLATAIASANVPIVVGHRTAVHDRAAISFAATLWRELAAGRPAELAIRTARMAILSQGWGSHWALPILFVRTDDTHLIEEPV